MMRKLRKIFKNLTSTTVENFQLKDVTPTLHIHINLLNLYTNHAMKRYKKHILEPITNVMLARIAKEKCQKKLSKFPAEIKGKAIFQIVLSSTSELIKNAIDADAKNIYFGFFYIGTDIVCIVQDDGLKRIEHQFPELRSGPVKYQQILKGRSKIKSDKSRFELGKCGRGLASIEELLAKCGGYLLVGKSRMGGATIKLVAPANAPTLNIEELKLDYGSYFGTGDADSIEYQEQITKRMSAEPPRPFLPLSPASNSASTIAPPPLAVPAVEETKHEEKEHAVYRLPRHRPAVTYVRDRIFRDEEERIRKVEVYSTARDQNQTIHISSSGRIKHRILYGDSGTPKRYIKFYKEGPLKGQISVDLDSLPTRKLTMPYGNIQSILFFNKTKTTQELVISDCRAFNNDPKNSQIWNPIHPL